MLLVKICFVQLYKFDVSNVLILCVVYGLSYYGSKWLFNILMREICDLVVLQKRDVIRMFYVFSYIV